MNGELVGHWTFSPTGGHSFSYAATWLDHPNRRSLSLSLPLSQGADRFRGPVVEAYFDNLLPDSPGIRQRLASRFGADSTQAFQLLEKIGRDCVGAVQLLPPEAAAPDVRRIDAEPLTEEDIERILDDTVGHRNPGIPVEDELRISIAGAQEKTALLRHDGRWCRPRGTTPTTHILKLPMGTVGGMRADFSTSVENEWLCARLVRAYGLPMAECSIQTFGRHKVLVVTRFDRILVDGGWVRLPQEDFCQVLGHPPGRKYEEHGGPGIAPILDTLRGSDTPGADRANFLTAQLIFWMLAAPDGHGKNFSVFIGAGDHFRATPLYDIMSAWPVIGNGAGEIQWRKLKLAMALRTKNAHFRMHEIRRRHWNEVAKANALGADFESVIERVIASTPSVIGSVGANLPADFPARVSDRIFEGLRAQVDRLGAKAG
ncbi:MAG: type II toxin-antitoxin system HipA family toxin [Rhodocyclaceae bacterium]|nr:type II toxin-antitoxin system HipA family toxin [Rhodocyclaceae bacterium]